MRELDVLLTRYLDGMWPRASLAEREAFDQLLDLPDPDLAVYLLGHAEPPESLRGIVDRLRGR